jgi:RNA polymerase sigma-70 factor (ECF subfamily)
MHGKMSDREIIGRVLQGDQQVFAELVKRYQHFVFTIAMRYANHREDAEEIAQDVFVKAYRSLSDFRCDSKFSTWLYTITMNTSITFLRKRKFTTLSLADEKILEQADMQGQTAENVVLQKSRVSIINEAIRLLNADDANIITLFYQGEQSLEEIGEIMGITPNNAKVKLHRARKRLKDKLDLHFTNEMKEMMN